MTKTTEIEAKGLRSKAEPATGELSELPGAGAGAEYADTHRLLHELQVHKVELETQNEVLRKTIEQLTRTGEHLTREVANLRLAEEALKRSEEFNRRIIASSKDCIKVLDLDGHILSLSEGGQQLLEIEDITPYLGSSWIDFWEDDREGARSAVAKAARGEVSSFYGCCPTVKGTPKWWEVVVSPIMGADNKIENLLAVSRDISERRQAEMSLRKLSSEMQRLLDVSAAGLARINRDQIYLSVNHAYAKISGMPLEQIIGNSLAEVVGEKRYAAIMPYIERVLNGEHVEYEIEVPFKYSGAKYLHVAFTPDKDDLGNIDGWVASVTDITERKKTEDALRRSQSMLTRTESITHTGSWEWEVATDTVTWSEELFRIVRRDPAAGAPSFAEHSTLYHPEDVEELKRVVGIALREGTPYEIELRAICPNGEIRYCLATGFAQRDDEGSITHLFGSLQDITERKQAEMVLLLKDQQLANSERFLKTIIESEPECIKILDKDCNLLMMNRAGLDMIEADTFEQVKGQCVCPLITEPYRDAFMTLTKRVFQGISGSLEFETIGFKGRHIWLETHAVPFRNEQGEIVALLGITRDVTGRKRLEEERIILEQQFQQAQKMESLGVLAGGIAHDFNNLLAVIIGRCSLAKMRPMTAVEDILQIETAAERATELCQQMLAYAGKGNISKSPIHLEYLVNEMINMSRATIGQNVTIIGDLSADIPSIMADASQVRQITMNLIINAAEAIGEARGEVRVSLNKTIIKAKQQEKDHLGAIIPPGTYVCLEVADNGCGMDTETQRRIFEPFFTTKFTGRGLGMSAVLGIITSHNGSLQLFSQPAHGTTFKVYLPVQAGSGEDQPQHIDSPPAHWKGNGTVLLVEDEEQVIGIAEAMLEELGFTVIRAYNGKEGLERYRQNAQNIKLVVTDIGMPVMDGYSLISELKKLKPDLPVIITSGYGEAEITSRIACEEIGGIINKPYNFRQLQDVVQRVAEGTPLAHA